MSTLYRHSWKSLRNYRIVFNFFKTHLQTPRFQVSSFDPLDKRRLPATPLGAELVSDLVAW